MGAVFGAVSFGTRSRCVADFPVAAGEEGKIGHVLATLFPVLSGHLRSKAATQGKRTPGKKKTANLCRSEYLRVVEGVKKVERVKGIEPSYAAWEAAVLPLNYTRSRFS
jgi:hypothetical protein